jgi:PAS domain S-box-containing protein
MLLKADGTIVDLNQPMAAALGQPAGQLRNTLLWPHLPAEKAAAHQSILRQVIQTRRQHRHVIQWDESWHELVFRPCLDPAGGIAGVAVVGTDITERQQAAAALHRQALTNERLRLALAAISQCPNLEVALLCLLQETLTLGGWDAGAVYLIEGGETVLRHHQGLNAQAMATAARPPWTADHLRSAPDTPQAAINLLEQFPDQRPRWEGCGFSHVYGAFLAAGGKPFAFLITASHPANPPGPAETGLIPILATETESLFLRFGVEAKLRQLSRQQRVILESAPMGISLVKNRRVLWANPGHDALFGYERGESVGLGTFEFYANAEGFDGVTRNAYQQQLAAGRVFLTELEMKRKDGSLFWCNLIGCPVDPANLEEGVIWMLQDATERRLKDLALKESEERYRRLFEAESDAIAVVDLGTRTFVDVNPAALRLYGYTREEFLALKHGDVSAEPEQTAKAVQTGLTHVALRWHRNKQGVVFPVEISGDYFEAQGRKLHVAVVRDVTERKRAEEQKEQLVAQQRLIQKAESLNRMAGAIAHHFNNQLGAALLSLNLAMQDLARGLPSAEPLKEAVKSVRLAAEISTLMLTYLGQTRSQQEPLDLSLACDLSLPLLRAPLPPEVCLLADLPAPGPVINASASQIQQLLGNLVANAWEACSERGGTVRLAVRMLAPAAFPTAHRFPPDVLPPAEPCACLEVADDGCGITPTDIDKIFDPFFSTKFTGRGLGLPVVLGIIRAHDGLVTVESQPGRGSLFRVFFPLSASPAPPRAVPAAPASRPPASGTILVVEDNAGLRTAIANAVKRLGYQVHEAADGVAAVALFKQHRDQIDCVLSDLTMPRMDGWGTIDAVRQLAPGIPFILASGYSQSQAMAGHHRERPQAFLAKPYDFDMLRDTLARVLEKKPD